MAILAACTASPNQTGDTDASSGTRGDTGSTADGVTTSSTGESAETGSSEAFAESEIGPDGGVLQADGARLTVPAGALATTETITMATIDAPEIDGLLFESTVWELSPSGLTFLLPVTVEFEAPAATAGAHVFTWSASDGSDRDFLATEVQDGWYAAETTHFTGYGVGKYPCPWSDFADKELCSACISRGIPQDRCTCAPNTGACPQTEPDDAAMAWVPGDRLPDASEVDSHEGDRDTRRMQEIRASVLATDMTAPACLTDLRESGFVESQFDCATGDNRNAQENGWVTPEASAAVAAIRNAMALDPQFGSDWDLHINGAMGNRSGASYHNFGSAIDMVPCKKSGPLTGACDSAAGCERRRDKLGDLARIAYATNEFAWVWYEDWGHVHASVSSGTELEESAGACGLGCEDERPGVVVHSEHCGGTPVAGAAGADDTRGEDLVCCAPSRHFSGATTIAAVGPCPDMGTSCESTARRALTGQTFGSSRSLQFAPNAEFGNIRRELVFGGNAGYFDGCESHMAAVDLQVGGGFEVDSVSLPGVATHIAYTIEALDDAGASGTFEATVTVDGGRPIPVLGSWSANAMDGDLFPKCLATEDGSVCRATATRGSPPCLSDCLFEAESEPCAWTEN